MTFPQIILHYLVMILRQKWGALNSLLLHSHCMSCPLPTPHLLLCPPPRQLSRKREQGASSVTSQGGGPRGATLMSPALQSAGSLILSPNPALRWTASLNFSRPSLTCEGDQFCSVSVGGAKSRSWRRAGASPSRPGGREDRKVGSHCVLTPSGPSDRLP